MAPGDSDLQLCAVFFGPGVQHFCLHPLDNLMRPMPNHLDVETWFARYEGGAPVGRSAVLTALAGAVTQALPHYRYFKSRTQFEFCFAAGTSYLQLRRDKGLVNIQFGVTHDEVESARTLLFGEPNPRLSNEPLTVFKSSMNMFPIAAGWASPHGAVWPVFSDEGLTKACAEAVVLVAEVVKPYLVANEFPAGIRATLSNAELSDGFGSFQTLFAIDFLMHREDWLQEDFERAISIVSREPANLALIRSHHAKVIERWMVRS